MWMAYMRVITTHYPLITHSNAVLSASGVPMFITPGAENCKRKKKCFLSWDRIIFYNLCYLSKVVVLFFVFVFSSKETTTQDIQIAPWTIRRYGTSLIIRKMKIKLTMRYNITYVRMTINKRT